MRLSYSNPSNPGTIVGPSPIVLAICPVTGKSWAMPKEFTHEQVCKFGSSGRKIISDYGVWVLDYERGQGCADCCETGLVGDYHFREDGPYIGMRPCGGC